MDSLFRPVADALGASVDQLKVIFCLLASYPLAAVYTRIHNASLKHLFSITISLFYLLAVFQLYAGTLQLFGSVLATYVVSANVSGRKMPWLVFALIMGHLTFNHIWRAIFEISLATFEITGPQMVLTMKLTTFAWNVYDGRQPAQSLDKWQLANRVTQMPSLLAFFGYAFYFPGMLVGPSLEFASYAALVASATPEDNKTSARHMPPGRKRVAYWRALQGIFFLGLFVLYAGSYDFTYMLEQSWFARPLWSKILFIQIAAFFARTKYYAIWRLTEGSAIVTGLGYTGTSPTGSTSWDGAANVNIWNIECAPNFKILLDSWNIRTNVWLRECVYKRVTPVGKKPGFSSSMITFATSAFWHGIAPGYYLTFVLGGFIQTLQRLLRSVVRPLFLPPIVPSAAQPGAKHEPPATLVKRIYDILGTVSTLLVLNYAVIPFILLEAKLSIEGWHRALWYGHYAVFVPLAFFWLGGSKWLKKVQSARQPRLQMPPSNGKNGAAGVATPGPHVVAPVHIVANAVEKAL